MEFVDDHDVETGGIEGGEPGSVEALDRREHMLERLRSMAPDPQLAEPSVARPASLPRGVVWSPPWLFWTGPSVRLLSGFQAK
jgi:hypothetical protein